MFKKIKNILERILVSDIVYNLLVKNAIHQEFMKVNKYWLCVSSQSNYLKCLLYWKIYERREVKFIKKYLIRDICTIELGASLGLTTTTICSILGEGVNVYSVEANPKIVTYLQKTKEKNNLINLNIISAAIDYSSSKQVNFILDDRNLASRKGVTDDCILVNTIKLSDIVKSNKIDEYNLVCDIEGAEVEMLLMEKDNATLRNCKMIIMEVHETVFEEQKYDITKISNLINDSFSMKHIASLGNIRVFGK